MKKINVYVGSILLVICLTVSGCWDRRELDQIAFVTGVGIDAVGTTKKVKIAFQIIKPAQMKSPESGAGSGGGEAFFVIESTGETTFDAIRNASLQSSHKLNFTHNSVIILSNAVAHQGIAPYLDLFVRDSETRPMEWILMTEEKPSDILKVKPDLEKASAMTIDGLIKNVAATSKINTLNLQELINIMLSKTRAAAIPMIKTTGPEDKKKLTLDGVAIFIKGKMVGKLRPNQTRGLLWVTGKVKSGIIVIPMGKKERVSLEIIQASGTLTPQRNKNKLIVKVRVDFICNLGGQMTKKDISDPEGLAILEKMAEKVVRKEIMTSVKEIRNLRADIFGFGDSFGIEYPKEWKKMEPDWDKLFPQVTLDLTIKPTVRLVGQTTKPVHPF